MVGSRATPIQLAPLLLLFGWAADSTYGASVSSVPPFINFQGNLMDTSGNPINGTHDMKFELSYGGTPLWYAEYTSVVATNGSVAVLLGSNLQGGTALDPVSGLPISSTYLPLTSALLSQDSSAGYTIQLTVDGDVLAPAFSAASSLFALKADSIGPYASTQLTHFDGSGNIVSQGGTAIVNSAGTWIGPAIPGSTQWTTSGANIFYNTGAVGIGTAAPVSSLHVGNAPTASADYGLVSLGSGYFDGATAGHYIGSASGTVIGINAAAGYAGDLVNYEIAGSSKFKVDSSGAVTATSFSGVLAGNASTATTATNTNTVATTQTSTNASFYPLFVSSSLNGNQPADLGTGLTFNPSTNTLATTTFSGALNGNATSATTATNATNATNATTATTATNVTGTVAISNGGSGATTQQAAINSLAGAVTSGYFLRGSGTNVTMSPITTGDVPTLNQNTTGNAANATNATNIATTQTSTNTSYFPLMVSSSANGNQAADLGTGLTFNPSTNTLMTTTVQAVTVAAQSFASLTYAPSSSSASSPPGVQLVSQNTGLNDGNVAVLRLSSANAASTPQSAYFAAVSQTAGFSPAVVFGRQTASSSYSETMRIDPAGNVGIGISSPPNPLSVSPVEYSLGTASQSGFIVTGIGTGWSLAMVGSELVFANGVNAGTITAFGSATSLTVTNSQTVASQPYTVNYPGLNVTSGGNVGIGISTPPTKLTVAGTAMAMHFAGASPIGAPSLIIGGAGQGTAVNFATGTDLGSTIAMTTGSSPGAGQGIVTVNFSTNLTSTPICVFSPGNANAAQASGSVYITANTTSYTLSSGSSALVGGSISYIWNVHCVQ